MFSSILTMKDSIDFSSVLFSLCLPLDLVRLSGYIIFFIIASLHLAILTFFLRIAWYKLTIESYKVRTAEYKLTIA